MTTAPHEAAGDALREELCAFLWRRVVAEHTLCSWADAISAAEGSHVANVVAETRSVVDDALSGPLAPVLAARATAEAERDAAQEEIAAVERALEGLAETPLAQRVAHWIGVAAEETARANAAESRVASLTAERDWLKAEIANLRTQVEAVPHADRVRAFYDRMFDRHEARPLAALRHQSEPRETGDVTS